MEPPEAPLTLREKHAAERTRADLKMAENRERKDWQGVFRSTLLPGLVTMTTCAGCCFSIAYFILWPLRETSSNNHILKEPYSKASTLFMNGDAEAAKEALKPILDKHPASHNANVLMAKILLQQEKRAEAAQYLRTARRSSWNPEEIDRQLKTLEPGYTPSQ